MSLEIKINEDIKNSMRSKDKKRLAALRAIKAELLLIKTGADTSTTEIPKELELKTLQKLVKQRKESAKTYKEQNREDLAEEELYQAEIIEEFLPKQMSKEEVEEVIKKIIADTSASSMKDMGKVMGMAQKEIAGKADNKVVSEIVKSLLS
jgi:uncharacterized protein YqeY